MLTLKSDVIASSRLTMTTIRRAVKIILLIVKPSTRYLYNGFCLNFHKNSNSVLIMLRFPMGCDSETLSIELPPYCFPIDSEIFRVSEYTITEDFCRSFNLFKSSLER